MSAAASSTLALAFSAVSLACLVSDTYSVCRSGSDWLADAAASLGFLEDFLEDPVPLLVVPSSLARAAFACFHQFSLLQIGLVGIFVGLEVTFSLIASSADPT
jgi:hypothetical protein